MKFKLRGVDKAYIKKWRKKKIEEVLSKEKSERWELNFLLAWADMFHNPKLKILVEKKKNECGYN